MPDYAAHAPLPRRRMLSCCHDTPLLRHDAARHYAAARR